MGERDATEDQIELSRIFKINKLDPCSPEMRDLRIDIIAAGFRKPRVVERPVNETGWLIEVAKGTPCYFNGSHFDSDSLNAIRFAREEDARKFATIRCRDSALDWRIVEHAWEAPGPSPGLETKSHWTETTSKDWYIKMAEIEGDSEIGAGFTSLPEALAASVEPTPAIEAARFNASEDYELWVRLHHIVTLPVADNPPYKIRDQFIATLAAYKSSFLLSRDAAMIERCAKVADEFQAVHSSDAAITGGDIAELCAHTSRHIAESIRALEPKP